MPWRVSFEICGDEFMPSRVPFTFSECRDAAVGSTGNGDASYVVPASVPSAERIRHIVETFEPLLPAIREAGATDWYISIARFYWAQCNESYSLEELQLIARLGCGFAYSAYSVSEEEERKLEQEYEPVA